MVGKDGVVPPRLLKSPLDGARRRLFVWTCDGGPARLRTRSEERGTGRPRVSRSMAELFTSPAASKRRVRASEFVDGLPGGTEVLIVSATRGAADDVARDLARREAATFGLHRFSLAQLAASLAATQSGGRRTGARNLACRPGDCRARRVRRTRGRSAGILRPGCLDARLRPGAGAQPARLAYGRRAGPTQSGGPGEGGRDLAALYDAAVAQFETGGAADRAQLFTVAREVLESGASFCEGRAVVLVDVAIDTAVERAFVVRCSAGPRDGSPACRRTMGRRGRRSRSSLRLRMSIAIRVTGSWIVFAGTCSSPEHRQSRHAAPAWSSSPRQAKAARPSRSRATCSTKRAGVSASTRWLCCCARRASIWVSSSTRSRVPASPRPLAVARGVRIPRVEHCWRFCRAPTRTSRRTGLPSTCRWHRFPPLQSRTWGRASVPLITVSTREACEARRAIVPKGARKPGARSLEAVRRAASLFDESGSRAPAGRCPRHGAPTAWSSATSIP